MALEILSVVVAGAGGAGVALFLRWLSRRRLPRWIVPVLAAAAMLAMAVSNEYGWYPRLRAGLPEGVVVAQTLETRAPWRPWSYVWPLVEGAFLVDRRRSLTSPDAPGVVITQVWRFARWEPGRDIMVAFDCAGARRVDLAEGVRIAPGGVLEGAAWVPLDPADPILRAACEGG